MATIRNPIEWTVDALKLTAGAVEAVGHAGGTPEEEARLPAVQPIGIADLRDVLSKGLNDFAAYRTDVLFIGLIYPVVGLVLARLAFGYALLPLVFPLASGFALIGPFAAVGLYEMSRRREAGGEVGWADAFGIVRSPSFAAIIRLGLLLVAIFILWLIAAEAIYLATLGPEPPVSLAAFVHDVFATAAGWTMIAIGIGVGFLFAVLVLTISVISFPLLLDRDVGVFAAVGASLRAVAVSPGPMALWGLIVAGGLVLGSIPALLGLIVVMPVLGHATWHLYRKVVPR